MNRTDRDIRRARARELLKHQPPERQPSKHPLPEWPQKANHLRRVQGIRRRLLKELRLIDRLAGVQSVPTRGRSVLAVLDDLEMLAEELPSSSPSFVEYRRIK